MTIKKAQFGRTSNGNVADLFTVTNSKGMEVVFTDYGATVVSLKIPDRSGKPVDVTLGYDTLEEYLECNTYFGCIAGRYANRIAGGKFALEGTEYTLIKNEGNNHLF